MRMAPEAKYCEKLEVVTKEIEICKFLTSNDSKVRKRGIISLKKWFREMGQKELVDKDDYNRIWNGLFYYVWMSDKPLVQEEAVECISGMIHLIENYESAMYYIRGFFDALVRQWDRISHYRIDKFLMFVRRFLRQVLVMLKNHEWNTEKLDTFSRELYTAVQILPYSLALHLNEIFTEEVAKVSKGKIPTESLSLLLKGYIECIANLRPTMQVVNSITSNVFAGLTRQLKLCIKQRALSGDGDVENGEPCEDGENNENEGALDPRPGGVDVFLPFIEFDENVVIEFIEQYRSRPGLPFKAKNILTQIIDMFRSITRLRTSIAEPVKSPEKTEIIAVDQSPVEVKTKAQKAKRAAVESPAEVKTKIRKTEKSDFEQSPAEVKTKVRKTEKSDFEQSPAEVKTKVRKTEKSDFEQSPAKVKTNIQITEKIAIDQSPAKTINIVQKTLEPVIDQSPTKVESSVQKIDQIAVERSPAKLKSGVQKSEQIVVNQSPSKVKTSVQKTEKIVIDQSPAKLKSSVQKTKNAVVDQSPAKVTRTRTKKLEPRIELTKIIDEISPRRTRSKSQKKPAETEESLKPAKKINESGVGRKSLRIAERQKKVQFNLEENTFQDISTYQKYIKLKPEIPFDGSKPSTTSILKPSVVSSPINPFYFPNGERKLKRKK